MAHRRASVWGPRPLKLIEADGEGAGVLPPCLRSKRAVCRAEGGGYGNILMICGGLMESLDLISELYGGKGGFARGGRGGAVTVLLGADQSDGGAAVGDGGSSFGTSSHRWLLRRHFILASGDRETCMSSIKVTPHREADGWPTTHVKGTGWALPAPCWLVRSGASPGAPVFRPFKPIRHVRFNYLSTHRNVRALCPLSSYPSYIIYACAEQ